MEALERYIVDVLAEDKATIEEVEQWIHETHNFFAFCEFDASSDKDTGTCWPYFALDCNQSEAGEGHKQVEFSQSTNSMIITALCASERAGFPRASSGHIASSHFERVNWKKTIEHREAESSLNNRIEIATRSLKNAWNSPSKSEGIGTHSGTYGNDDIFTLSWYFDIFSKQEDREHQTVREQITDKIVDRAKIWLEQTKKGRSTSNILSNSTSERNDAKVIGESSYIFLRFARLIKSIHHIIKNVNRTEIEPRTLEIIRNALDTLGEIFHTRLHDQLSYYEIEDAGFDPAELAFCFEGLSHCHSHMINSRILDRVFNVIVESQSKTSHLRTETPIITRHTGEALFTVSVETMNALLSSLSMFDTGRPYKMTSAMRGAKYLDIFRRYFEWLGTRRSSVRIDDDKIHGWHSEHINNKSIIHTWETSQVLEFLHSYRELVMACSARNLLILSKAEFDFHSEPNPWKEFVAKFEPNNQFEEHRIYHSVGEDFVKPHLDDHELRNWSMLLYGPPGTGKSTLAKNIAKAIGGQFIELTVSDFLSSGSAQMESRAKAIFTMLSHQPKSVVLLDEMDQFFLDRNSALFNKQDSSVQFLTPGMLTKLANLRATERIIFIIATNFEDRIDPAIKRRGRIDKAYLLLPPDGDKRIRMLEEVLKRFSSDLAPQVLENSGLLKAASCFLGYKDIEEIAGRRPEDIGKLVVTLAEAPRSIRFHDYSKRCEQVSAAHEGINEEIHVIRSMAADLSQFQRQGHKYEVSLDRLYKDVVVPLESLNINERQKSK